MVLVLRTVAILLSIFSVVVIYLVLNRFGKVFGDRKEPRIALSAFIGFMLLVYLWIPLFVDPYINKQADRVAKEFIVALNGDYEDYAEVSRKYFEFTIPDHSLKQGYALISNWGLGDIDPDQDLVFARHKRRDSGTNNGRDYAQITDHYYLFKPNDNYIVLHVLTAGLNLSYKVSIMGGGNVDEIKKIQIQENNKSVPFTSLLPNQIAQ